MGFSEEDRRFMRRALALAGRGRGMTNPNPMVGAVVVKNGKIVAEGFHRGPFTPHAEAEAITQAGGEAEGSTLYVNLEPCNHQGRTPPCTEGIIAAGVRRVVMAASDPNPAVRGGGEERLRGAGLTVESGLLAAESSLLNEAYEKHVTTGKPLVVVKMAATADGKIAARNGESRWITGEKARRMVHAMRRESDAVLVGRGTVQSDDPELTVREVPLRGARPPLRVVVDSRLSMPLHCRLAQGGVPGVIVATTPAGDEAKAERLRERGVEVMVLPGSRGRVDLAELLTSLGRREVARLLVEGGPTLVASLLDEGLADRLCLFIAPRVFGDAEARSWAEGREVTGLEKGLPLRWRGTRRVGEDLLLMADTGERRLGCSPG
ncbi:MAG: bifunctional diaminohydroxyphosphoribosylaminopyrimidine deaminase/5-amino-6-(5-phosphoribosylamino)uracil reductase RibD [Actinomycetota bacterium]|nr:bifunctional diaminohydroxyphosphoribosylaminopyrimidine deaminase/5-amino-6-(5-phosphoribosylamino)uracil reductase RibD [Actinomycetota bacterium]MDD5667913.1 bifunctional diaminohydroxyphosphoribosylaminopyrimidine deaminase/5-amino-6-(5-phosphoribosylamino)uracil reductase RibD [Actinomycetota bacterium]